MQEVKKRTSPSSAALAGLFPILLSVAFILLLSTCDGAPSSDEIVDLPGLPTPVGFRQYSGYLTASDDKKLHYWFVECEHDKDTTPLVLWLNGGPGCSSLDGLLGENGPFSVDTDGKSLKANPYSWNKLANVLYLEAPAGVGFSYSGSGDYATDDDTTAWDNYMALKSFFAAFPEYSDRDLYLTGESYAGIYIPTLAVHISNDPTFGLKGLMIGNALSDDIINDNSEIVYGYYHGMFGLREWEAMVKQCCSDGDIGGCNFFSDHNKLCNEAVQHARSLRHDINPYNIMGGCAHPSQKHLQYWSHHNAHRQLGNPPKYQQYSGPSCLSSELTTAYLNSKDVRGSLHIPEFLPDWDVCRKSIGQQYTRQFRSMSDIYQYLLSSDQESYRVLLYNGDTDMVCNFLGEQWFVESLNLKATEDYGPWYYKEEDGSHQVGGLKKEFGNLVFATVRGAGHMVPTDRPRQALAMLRSFLHNKSL